ncbi:hypothetical protein B0H34DRAFT_668655 [Crassisporium funariophilum]|nr:hypothetical protein B0H34DRAFT_668655 [Crassisporium funariophilum]
MNIIVLSEDVLIYIASFLTPPDILQLGRTCKRLLELSELRIVWTNACTTHILSKGYPFPRSTPLSVLPVSVLRQHTLRACRIAQKWLSGSVTPYRERYILSTSLGTSVSDVRFVPGHDERLVLTISWTVWSAIVIWDVSIDKPKKLCEWSPRGAIISGVAPNSENESEVTVIKCRRACVKVLCLDEGSKGSFSLREVYSVGTRMKVMTLVGELLALSDAVSQTALWNWKNGTYALLQHTDDVPPTTLPSSLQKLIYLEILLLLQYNHCLQVLFAHQSILVARARSIYLFPLPLLQAPSPGSTSLTPYTPIAQHSFGGVHSVSVTICPHPNHGIMPKCSDGCSWHPLSILVRGEGDDPWASDAYTLDLYKLETNPSYIITGSDNNNHDDMEPRLNNVSPYLFPPILISDVQTRRDALCCKSVILGQAGTAMWIQDRRRGSLPRKGMPSLMMAVFPGPLSPSDIDIDGDGDGQGGKGKMGMAKKVRENHNWTAFDYDESLGRIALGSKNGVVTILEF